MRSGDVRSYEHVYSADGALAEVLVNARPTWRYTRDAHGRVAAAAHHATVRKIAADARGAVRSAGDVAYHFDADGFLAHRGDHEV